MAEPPVVATRVLRAGPPQGRKGWLDVAVGVLGVLLLLVSGVFAVVLPKDPPIPLEFQVTVIDQETQLEASIKRNFTEQQTESFEFQLPDNVYSVTFTVNFIDDVAASDPDAFQVEATDNRGRVIVSRTAVVNPLPAPVDQSLPLGRTTAYEAFTIQRTFTAGLSPRPEDRVEPALRQDETAQEVHDRLMEELTIPSEGIWTVQVTMTAAGDCPKPDPQPETTNRALACNGNTGAPFDGGQAPDDTGNPFTLEDFIYRSFDLAVQELEA